MTFKVLHHRGTRPRANVRACSWAGLYLCGLLAGCSQSHPPATPAQAAAHWNARGVDAKDPQKARELFQKAIAADPYYGPALTNLGIVLLNEGNYFEAAKAFDGAIRLMPTHPMPRLYLGLVYERAGEYVKAIEPYQEAVNLAPDSMAAIQALTRVQVKLEQIDDKAIGRLRVIAVRGTDAAWQSWATRTLIHEGISPTAATTAPRP